MLISSANAKILHEPLHCQHEVSILVTVFNISLLNYCMLNYFWSEECSYVVSISLANGYSQSSRSNTPKVIIWGEWQAPAAIL